MCTVADFQTMAQGICLSIGCILVTLSLLEVTLVSAAWGEGHKAMSKSKFHGRTPTKRNFKQNVSRYIYYHLSMVVHRTESIFE